MAGEVIRVEGVDELLKKLDAPRLVGRPAKNFLNRWRLYTEREAKANAPVWQGLLRRSITSDVDAGAFPRSARVGTNAPHAKPMEYGTGLLSDAPDSGRRRYFPPPDALEPWAQAHGMTGRQAAQAIWRKGGTPPRRYLRDAAEASAQQIPAFLAQMAAEIEAEAGHGAG